MKIKLLRPKAEIDSPFHHPGIFQRWRVYYIPPWSLVYHIFEIVCILLFYICISTPTINFYYLNRQVFVDAFYPDYEYPDEPITTVDEIIDYFDAVNESLYLMIDHSFMDIHLTEREYPVLCEILYLNGTHVYQDIPDIDLNFFYHLSYIIISVDFYVFSNSTINPGCSRWQIQSKIYANKGTSQFSIIPAISRTQCNKSFIRRSRNDADGAARLKSNNKKEIVSSNVDLAAKARMSSKKSFATFKNEIKKIKRKRLNKGKHMKPDYSKRKLTNQKLQKLQKNIKNINDCSYEINQNANRFYRMSLLISIAMFLCSTIHFISLIITFRRVLYVHFECVKTNPEYRSLPPLDQFHLSIGYWRTIDFLCTIMIISWSVFLFFDTQKMTQFPSQSAIEFLSLAAFVSIIRFNQWYGNYLPFYQLIVILREAFSQLAYLVVSILPIVTGLSLFGIFIFGFIDDSYETFRYLVQRMITSGMGDSIDDFFIITADGTTETAWLSFFYVGIITALGMWIIFTSCIATVSYVHQNYIVLRDSYWESSSDTATEEESN